MKFQSRKRFLVPAVATAVLAACGGGSDIEPDDLVPTLRPASVFVSNATTPALNGTYSTTSINLTQVVKFNPIGEDPERCSFRFSGLQGPNGVLMDGDIRYLPGTFIVHTMFMSIAGVQFGIAEGANTAVDRANDEIDFTGKVFNPGTPQSLTLTGSIPMPLGRPEGC